MQSKQVSVTRQRQAILDALRSVVSHPTADEVHQMVRKQLPRISLGTVYRNLEMMSEKGLVLKLNTAGEQMRFDGSTHTHYHVRCTQCGRVDDVPVEPMQSLNQAAEDACGYSAVSHSVEFAGICPDCAAKSTATSDQSS